MNRTKRQAPTVEPAQWSSGKRVVCLTHYDYLSVTGTPHLRATWVDYADGGREVLPFHWDTQKQRYIAGQGGRRRIPFNAKEVDRAEHIYFVNNEPCAVALENHLVETGQMKDNLAVTTIMGGCDGWTPDLAEWFTEKAVVIVPNHSVPGYDFAWKVEDAVQAVKGSAAVYPWPRNVPTGYDIAHAITEGRWV